MIAINIPTYIINVTTNYKTDTKQLGIVKKKKLYLQVELLLKINKTRL